MRRADPRHACLLALLLAACVGGDSVPESPGHAALREPDLRQAAKTMQQALETLPDGQRLAWQGEGGEVGGSFRPLRTFVTSGGFFCRAYEEELQQARAASRFEHEACRSDEGVWIWL